MKKLNAMQVQKIKKLGFHRVDTGLYLRVRNNGHKSWVQRIVIDGRRSDISIGGYPGISLGEARKRAAKIRVDVLDGHDPVAEKRAEKRKATMPTFRQAAERTLTGLAPTWKSDRQQEKWQQTLEKHAMPTLADIPVDRITKHDVLTVLEPIWHSQPDTARRVRQRIRAILKYCQAHDYVENNVAGEGIDGALPKNQNGTKHYRAMPYYDVPEAFQRIDSDIDALPVRLCIEFVILTATRSGEARGAEWSEIDLDTGTWTIPAERMKMSRPHRVPLSSSALAVLEEAKQIRKNYTDLVFPSPVNFGRTLTDCTLRAALQRVGLADKTVVHGFRSSFRTWALEQTDVPWEICEAALAHEIGNKVERSYARSDLLERRRGLMQSWGDFVKV